MTLGQKAVIQQHMSKAVTLAANLASNTGKTHQEIQTLLTKIQKLSQEIPGTTLTKCQEIEDKIEKIARLNLLFTGCADEVKQISLMEQLNTAYAELEKKKAEFDKIL